MYSSDLYDVVFGMFGLGIILFVLVLLLAVYLVKAFAIYQMASKRGIDKAWLAFIPYGMDYIMGKLIGEITVTDSLKLDASTALPIGRVAANFISWIPGIGTVLGGIASIAFSVFYFMALYKLYKLYKSENSVVYLVLSIIFGDLAQAVILMMIRNLEPAETEVIITDQNAN